MEDGAMNYLMGLNAGNGKCENGFGGFGLLIILFFLMFGGGFFGRNNMANANEGFESLLAGQNQIKNQMGYDNLSASIRGVQQGICDSTFALNNAINTGFSNTQQTLCQGFAGVNSSVTNSSWNLSEKLSGMFANNNIQLQAIQNSIQSCCCDLKNTITSSVQNVLNALDANEKQSLREQLFRQSQREQTKDIAALINANTTPTA